MNSAPVPRLLLVLPAVPWPIRRDGMSLRFAPLVDYLARRYELDLLVLAREDEPTEPTGSVKLCRSVRVIQAQAVPLPRLARKIRSVWSGLVPWGLPLGAARHKTALEHDISDLLQSERYSAVIWAAGFFDAALRVRRRHPGVRFVMDWVDSPALSISRLRTTRRDLRLLSRYTAWKWRRLERRVRDVFDASIYISLVDARTARADPGVRAHVIPNGITVPDAQLAQPRAPAASPVIGFLGNMSYEPNISAALRLARRVFPQIKAVIPDARLLIIGRDPPPVIAGLANASIEVTGAVEDIWSHITRATVCVFPMVEGAGLQNKILEAMYAEVPVVTTAAAASGVGAVHAEHLLIGETDEDIVDQTLRLLREESYARGLARRAREFVVREFDWTAILPRYEAIIAPAAENRPFAQHERPSPG